MSDTYDDCTAFLHWLYESNETDTRLKTSNDNEAQPSRREGNTLETFHLNQVYKFNTMDKKYESNYAASPWIYGYIQ